MTTITQADRYEAMRLWKEGGFEGLLPVAAHFAAQLREHKEALGKAEEENAFLLKEATRWNEAFIGVCKILDPQGEMRSLDAAQALVDDRDAIRAENEELRKAVVELRVIAEKADDMAHEVRNRFGNRTGAAGNNMLPCDFCDALITTAHLVTKEPNHG